MTVLHLGVIELPYAGVDAGKIKIGKRSSGVNTMTTGDVAEILENEYHLMEIFFESNAPKIADLLGEALKGSLETAMMGGPTEGGHVLESATGEIEGMFKDMISQRGFDALGYPGIPTEAAKNGVNHRFAHPYTKRDPRPSFRDTGLYQSSFKVWVE